MKTSPQLMIFKLSALSTLLLCSTANNYASDIEIYKASSVGDGKARVVLNLDNSSFMSPEPSGSSGGSTTLEIDYPNADCPKPEKYATENESVTYNGKTYTYLAQYCPDKNNNTIKYYSRLTMMKRSALSVINNPNLGEGIELGLSFFPKHTASPADGSANVTRPLPLTATNRDLLSNIVAGLRIAKTNAGEKQVPIAQGYGDAAETLLKTSAGSDISVDTCSGYGIFTLTSGSPVDDNLENAKAKVDNVLVSGQTLSSTLCTGGSGSSASTGIAWQCVNQAAKLLAAGKARIGMPVKSTVVSFGTGFSFSPRFRDYSADVTEAMIDADYSTNYNNNIKDVLGDQQWAAKTGLNGGGGYFSAKDTAAVSDQILKFIEKVKNVDIPYLITGAPTIPQDPLNPALVQNKVYYSQFKPTPTTAGTTSGNQLWLGNLKKYRINDLGEIIAKNDIKVIDSLGRLVNGTYDYWAPSVSTDPAIAAANENTPGSELYARMGGVRSQLPLGTSIVDNITVENRKLLTNRVVSNDGTVSERTTLTQIKRADYGTNGTAASDPKKADIVQLLDLRQVGAVMHSSPLLLTNKGKVVYDSTADSLSTTNREDYILFGSTQGLLHVVKADDYTSSSGGGKEVFAFVPHEMVEKQNKAFSTPDQATGGTANLFYGIDAPWTAYTEYVVDSSGNLTVGTGKAIEGGGTTLQGKQMVYGGLRMGGRSYYALNLGDMTNPRLMFHIDPKDQKVYYNNSSKTFSPLQYMGESWSKPKIAWVKWDGTRKLVMFVGGGYDAGGTTGNANNGGYESDSYNQTNGIGAGVYMFDALNGDLLWWASNNATATSPDTTSTGVIAYKDANLKYSVVSEIKTADRNNDGLVDNLYFGDLSGQVFRIDLNNNASTIGAFATRVVRLLNAHESSGEKSPRFYAAPGFSIYKDKGTGKLFAAISIGSGNLSRPLVQYAQNESRPYDALYTIYDKDVTRADLYTTTSLDTQDVTTSTTATKKLNEITDANRFNLSADAPVAPYESSYGWYYKFKGDSTSKPVQQEKLFYSPTVIDNDLYISSYDSDKLGLTGVCGGGVQGESKVRLFCMPFGQCLQSRGYTVANSISKHGPGIQNHAIGGTGGTEGGTTRLIGGAILDSNLDDKYQTKIKFIPQRWYQRY